MNCCNTIFKVLNLKTYDMKNLNYSYFLPLRQQKTSLVYKFILYGRMPENSAYLYTCQCCVICRSCLYPPSSYYSCDLVQSNRVIGYGGGLVGLSSELYLKYNIHIHYKFTSIYLGLPFNSQGVGFLHLNISKYLEIFF